MSEKSVMNGAFRVKHSCYFIFLRVRLKSHMICIELDFMYSHIRVELIVLSMQISLWAVTEKKIFLAYKLNDPLQFYSLSCFHL